MTIILKNRAAANVTFTLRATNPGVDATFVDLASSTVPALRHKLKQYFSESSTYTKVKSVISMPRADALGNVISPIASEVSFAIPAGCTVADFEEIRERQKTYINSVQLSDLLLTGTLST